MNVSFAFWGLSFPIWKRDGQGRGSENVVLEISSKLDIAFGFWEPTCQDGKAKVVEILNNIKGVQASEVRRPWSTLLPSLSSSLLEPQFPHM